MKVSRKCRAGVVSIAALTAGVSLTACSSSKPSASSATSAVSASSGSCSGAPVKLFVSTNLSSTAVAEALPEMPDGANAAAAAINKQCELGRPVQIISCNDQFSTNGAASCARQAVSDNVTAVVGDEGSFGDSSQPILDQAGIPDMVTLVSAQSQSVSPDVFGMAFSVNDLYAQESALASVGATKVNVLAFDIPSVTYLLTLLKSQAATLGITLNTTPVPPTATDMTQYVAQATSNGTNGLMFVLAGAAVVSTLKALAQQGTSLSTVHVACSSNVVTRAVLSQVGSAANGMLISGSAWPANDTSNPGIAKYISELKADNQPTASSDYGVATWTAVHVVADLLKGSPTINAAVLKAKLNTATVNQAQMPPINWGQKAFPTGPLAALRIFTNEGVVSRITNGNYVPITNGFVNVTQKFSVNG
jgi:ABC-type branched-subunit amino acid transport system substrate-binding protein